MDEFDSSNQENLLYKKYNAIFKLNHRNVVSVTGEDAESFLQSLMTNDMKILKDTKVAMSALFLNPKGRILFDSIIVKSHL
jgi:folate-binding Fe-S cluster repair protein YgfZ